MQGSTPARLLSLAILLAASPEAHAGELRTISRNTLVFVDAVKTGGEWAAYRLVDERRPAIFRAEGPARVVLKLRTTVGTDPKPAVAAILNDERIVLTARVDPVRDPDVRLVEATGKAPSKPRVYVVRLGPGEHTVTVRYSEGAPILLAATYLEGRDPTELVSEGEGEGDVPLADSLKPKRADGVQRIGRVGDDGEASELEPDGEEPASAAAASATTTPSAEAVAMADPELWKSGDKPRPGDEARGELREREVLGGDVRGGGLLPPEAFQRRASGPKLERALTVTAPWLSGEVRGGVLVSRLGLDPAPVVGVDLRVPLPLLDARRFSLGASLDVAWARGSAVVRSEGARAPIDVASLHHTSLQAGLDLRWTFLRIDGVLDPWIGAGFGVLAGSLGTESAAVSRTGDTFAVLGLARVGAAFGPLGSRPFFELRLAGGRLRSDLARDAAGGDPGYLEVNAVVGWRLELLTEAPAE